MSSLSGAPPIAGGTVPPPSQPAGAVTRDDLGALKSCSGIEIVGRYRAAVRWQEVGGDWYDAFPLPDGTCALVVGDVAGHDVDAAARMTQIRAATRALAYDRSQEPDQLLRRLDALVCGLDVADMVTVAYAVLEPAGDRSTWSLRWSSAGHPPPLVVGRHGTAQYLAQRNGIVLGVAPDEDRPVNARLLPAGCTLVLHTDGLVEHRGRDIDDGMRVAEVTAGGVGRRPLSSLCDALMDACADSEDDVAVLAARLLPPEGCPQAG